jgi:hypothetical protein
MIVSVCGVVLASLLGVTSRQSLDTLRASQALAVAQGGLNWYMMRLAGVNDWTTETDITHVALGPGEFDVAILSQTPGRISFTVTGKVQGNNNTTIQRTMSQAVRKLPLGSQFALFWGRLTGSTLNINNTTVTGDYWSRGTTDIANNSTVAGVSFRPDNQDITGGGVYSEMSVATPYLSMPVIDTSFYDSLMATYDAMEDACGSGSDINQTTNLVLSGNTLCCRDFDTNGNITISGYGYIVANRDIRLHDENSDSGIFTISPSGGEIVFVAGRSVIINSNKNDTTVTVYPGVRFYSRSQGVSNGLVDIRNDTTNIDGALILSARQLLVEKGANLTNTTLFVADAGSTTNNVLSITGSGTNVGTLPGPCTIISMGRNNSGGASDTALTVDSGANAVGLLYQYDTANMGLTRINSATITGALIANQFQGDAINNATVTYNQSALPSIAPQGLPYYAAKEENSWDGI